MEVFQNTYIRDINLGDRWLQMPASAYFPDQFLYATSRIFFSIKDSLLTVAISKFIILFLSLRYFIKLIYSSSNTRAILLSLIVSLIFIPSYEKGYMPLYAIEYNHFSHLILILIILPRLISGRAKFKFIFLITIFFICFLTGLSTSISLIITTSYLFAYLFVEFLYTHSWKSFKLLYYEKQNYIITILSGIFLGYFSYSKYINENFMGDRLLHTPSGNKIFSGVKKLFEYNPEVTPFSIILILIGIFIYLKLKKIDIAEKINKINSISFIISFFSIASLGGIVDNGYYRYFYSFIIIYLINILYILSVNNLSNYYNLFLSSLFLIPYQNYYFSNKIKDNNRLNIRNTNIAECINDSVILKKTDKRVGVGIQDYWDANINAVQLNDPRIDLVVMNLDGSPRLWMQNIGTMESIYNDFYLLTKNNQDYIIPHVKYLFGKCKDSSLKLYHLDNKNDFVDYYKKISEYNLKKLKNHRNIKQWRGDKFISSIALSNKFWGLIVTEGKGILYIPSIDLNPGRYRLRLFYSLLLNGNDNKSSIQITCVNSNPINNELANSTLETGIANTKELIFDIPRTPRCDGKYQVIINVSGDEKLYVNDLIINTISN
ncbi:hypothetical protein [Prochlorococcus marinus]|uniref:hypothetical protein n=1 Tax=Prochlorococcus marinus TaxID=1219 RepID=UPI0022B3B972|nr:hypothetical protein [Prochlorococcus marinus]